MPDLNEWNLQSLALVQAGLGAISPNFRMISLGHDGREWVMTFVLHREEREDLEEIDDIVTEWEALQDRPTPVRLDVSVTEDELPWPASPVRVLYRRREPPSAT